MRPPVHNLRFLARTYDARRRAAIDIIDELAQVLNRIGYSLIQRLESDELEVVIAGVRIFFRYASTLTEQDAIQIGHYVLKKDTTDRIVDREWRFWAADDLVPYLAELVPAVLQKCSASLAYMHGGEETRFVKGCVAVDYEMTTVDSRPTVANSELLADT